MWLIQKRLKIFFTYILLLSFAFRPVYTVTYIGYFELNIDYIIETYCINKEKPELKCNGQCHLADQLNFSDDTNEGNYALIVEAFFPVYFQSTTLHIEGETYTKLKLKSRYNYILPFYNSPNYKISAPPKLS